MNDDTFRIRKYHKLKMIDEHEKAIRWHNREIAKIIDQINRLTKTYENSVKR